jgi:hypothetical protein
MDADGPFGALGAAPGNAPPVSESLSSLNVSCLKLSIRILTPHPDLTLLGTPAGVPRAARARRPPRRCRARAAAGTAESTTARHPTNT